MDMDGHFWKPIQKDWFPKMSIQDYFPKCMCDLANISPECNIQKLYTLKMSHFQFREDSFLPKVVHCVLLQLLFQRFTGHASSTAATTYIKCASGVCVCREFRAAMNYSTGVGFSQMKVKADQLLLHHSVPSVNPSMQQGGINDSSLLLCERYVEALKSLSQPLDHSSPLCSHDQPSHPH